VPELPEVETTRRGLAPHLTGHTIAKIVVRDRRLRWPVARSLPARLRGALVAEVSRRGKYLLVDCSRGWLIIHLGMSGSLRLLPDAVPAGKHDHVDIVLSSGRLVRLTDPRRFGAVLWGGADPLSHPLLASLAPEPFSDDFDADWLHRKLAGRAAAIKSLLMDSHIVTGVGNIYASEALFRARIHPSTPGRRISRARCARLIEAIRETLSAAIAAGGSSLRNFVGSDGNPGYFQQQYLVYDREKEACRVCGGGIRAARHGQRATYYCPRCQKT
jgi:formamidopyrimidine-DNA glycosylase